MLKYKNKLYNSRKELKLAVGGTNAYNRLFKNGDVEFIPNNIASNDERRIKISY